MEYVVPLIIVLVIVLIVVVASRLIGRRNQSAQAPVDSHSHPPVQHPAVQHPPVTKPAGRKPDKGARRGRESTREGAQEASARLTPESHRLVYSLIAQHQVLNAIKAYRKATHTGLGEAAAAVAALAEFPQPSPEPAAPTSPEPPAAADSDASAEPEPQVPSVNAPLTVEDIMNAAPGPAASEPSAAATPARAGGYRYRAIVSQGEEIREVASTRLNEGIFNRIRELALAGNYDGAARLLREHSDIGETEAREFVLMISPDE